MTLISNITVDLKAAEAAASAEAQARAAAADHAIHAEFVTLFPVSLIWAHKGLLVLYGAAVLAGGFIGHAVQ